jgi:hypothetical protein
MERPSRQAPTQNTTTARANPPAGPRPATRGQRDYLAILANRTGMAYTPPTTFAQALAEIARLRKAKRSNAGERQAELKQVSRALTTGPASSVQDHEVDGYGSSARWSDASHTPDDDTPRGDERCRALGDDWANPYYQGLHRDGKVIITTRTQARRAYAQLLWRHITTSGQPTIDQLAALHGHIPGCYCRLHPCDRDTLIDAAAWAANQRP